MIFGNLFKSKKDEEKAEEQAVDVAVAPTTQHDASADDTASQDDMLASASKKKTKETKINKALLGTHRKQRSNRTPHPKRSFHSPNRLSSSKTQMHLHDVLKRPRLSEKSAASSGQGVYVFEVATYADKHMVAEAIELAYKVKPTAVRVAKIPAKGKRIRVKGREREQGFTAVRKKAFVTLKKGDTIQLG